MCHKVLNQLKSRSPAKLPRKLAARGFSLVSAIFLLVILAALGIFMLSIYTSQRTISNQDVRGVLAYQAAKTGIEAATYAILAPENAAVVNTIFNGCTAGMAAPTLDGALTGFNVTIDCQITTTTEAENTIRVYQITSTGRSGNAPSSDFVERQISASISTCRIGVTGLATDPPC